MRNAIWLPRVNTNPSQIYRSGGKTLCSTDGREKEMQNIEIDITILPKLMCMIAIIILTIEDKLVAQNNKYNRGEH